MELQVLQGVNVFAAIGALAALWVLSVSTLARLDAAGGSCSSGGD